jgi:hypothetical protein
MSTNDARSGGQDSNQNTDDDGPQLLESTAVKTVPKRPTAEHTVAQIRTRIAMYVGGRTTPETPLDIRTLNMCYCWFEGRYRVQPRNIGTQSSPGPGGVRTGLAVVMLNEGYRGIASFVPAPGDPDVLESRPFRKGELLALFYALWDTEDSRNRPSPPWSQGEGDDDGDE